MSNKEIGRIGLGMAINYFTLNGYTVSIPLNDTQWYDLIVEKDENFYTVQAKATMTQDSSIDLRSCGGTNGGVYDSVLNHPQLDYIFCVNKDLKCWLIPFKVLADSGIANTFRLRTKPSSSICTKLDTSNYQVQF